MDTITNMLIDTYTFERIQSLTEEPVWNNMTYAQFVTWNIKCFEELDTDEAECIVQFCKYIKLRKIKLVDEEHCSEITAKSIYFNTNKKLCIVNPR